MAAKTINIIKWGTDPKNRRVQLVTDGKYFWVRNQETDFVSEPFKTQNKTLELIFNEQIDNSQ